MDFQLIFTSAELKPKEKTEQLSAWVCANPMAVSLLIEFASKSKDPVKATCMEALEFASRNHPDLAAENWFDFALAGLVEKAPRIKWESAKVIGNIAGRFADKLEPAIEALIKQAGHEGTVVRWSAAFALGEIVKLKKADLGWLRNTLEQLAADEEKNSIQKIYLSALKKSAG